MNAIFQTPAATIMVVAALISCPFASAEDSSPTESKHIVTYQAGEDVPESKLAVEAGGKQVRYFKIPAGADKGLTKIEFIKGGDFSIPLVFAVTVEFASGGQ